MQVTRRAFLAGSAALLGTVAIGSLPLLARQDVPGDIVGANAGLGHLLRSGNLPEPVREEAHDVVIVGGGAAGLSAAWKLQKLGVARPTVVEMETQTGGNAVSGVNTVSAYPWGAHYLPLPGEDAAQVRELLEEFGVITGRDADGLPIYDEFALCADPHERLYCYGRWQEGLVPVIGASAADHRDYAAFFEAMADFRVARGSDGRRAFTIPLEMSSRDEAYIAFDRLSMRDYLVNNGWQSERLHWFVNYGCRDDYGTDYAEVSAWAGIHYFAARGSRAANADGGTVLTWPEGNGWLVRQLRRRMNGEVKSGQLVWRVRKDAAGVAIDSYDPGTKETVRLRTKAAILAVPRFVADRLLDRASDAAHSYAPWMVANITLNRMPAGKGEAPAWDNVIYNSPSLGYVVATHQRLEQARRQTVITYYWPLSDTDPATARRAALARSAESWKEQVLTELLRVHPELEGQVARCDIWLWGHGMIRPTPGYLWGSARAEACRQQPPVFFAHSDMSGLSLFEEAHYRGVTAAEAVAEYLA